MKRRRYMVSGAVQGVGFRPLVYRLACEINLGGWVKNTPEGVLMELEGEAFKLDDFEGRLDSELPPAALISDFKAEDVGVTGEEGFEILESGKDSLASVPMLADMAVCKDCLREMRSHKDRRYCYPFITCTNCGPRYTIMTGLPYDRPQTTMKDFSLCVKCTKEYMNLLDRRFHAQPVACSDCGPHLYLADADGEVLSRRDEALLMAAEAIKDGKIVAIKGIGGFHLVCNACDEGVVAELRRRKHRPVKPFAVMTASVDEAEKYCFVSDLEADLLGSMQAPIVLLKVKDEGWLAGGIAPGNPYLGVMLPYAPLHHLLMDELGFPIVATSGNRAGEPICTDENEAISRLEGIADLFLAHNRPIAHRCEDSIVRIMGDRAVMLRRARGYAPLPLSYKAQEGSADSLVVLAAGSHLKNTVAISIKNQVIVGPHVGDLDTEQAIEGHEDSINTLCGIYGVVPEVAVFDAHPDYYSSKRAMKQEYVQKKSVQHHYAHALACMLDNQYDGECLAIVWDGTGYGDDGNVWGGEFLKIAHDGYERVGHMHPFLLPGGDAAAKEPWRVAVSLLAEAGEEMEVFDTFDTLEGKNISFVRQMLDKRINCPVSTSAGRLFDGVSSLLGICHENSFEGEAAMGLEFIADPEEVGVYPYLIEDNILDWRPIVRNIAVDDAPVAATKFHNTLVDAGVRMAKRFGIGKVLLTGGCFQNKLLLEGFIERLDGEGMEPMWHRNIPPNDGGISAGQIYAAIRGVN